VEDGRIPRGVTTLEGGIVHVHFDGACQPPKGPGIATFGFTIEGPGFDVEESGLATPPYSERSTNNVAEYVAAIRALEWLRARNYRGPVVVSGDSQLVIRQMKGEYEVRADHLRAYHEWLTRLSAEFSSVEWHWIPRAQNSRADALSKQALVEAGATARRLRPLGARAVVEDEPDPDGDPPD
jgi:ribonuclease HI